MNILQMYGALVFCLSFNIDQAKEHNNVTNESAIKKCKNKGGLAPSMDFNPVPETVSYPPEHTKHGVIYDDLIDLNLNNGESAWVAGFSSYSLPVVFTECAVWTENIGREANGTSIYSCLNYCGYNTSITNSYIGVNSRYCVCLTRQMVEANRTQCDPANDKLLGVFEVKTEKVKDELLYQCSYLQLNISTAKCTEKHNSVCFIGNKEECINNKRHYFVNDSGTNYCIVAETKSWLDSINHCKNISASILPDVRPHLVSEINARVNDGSWVGTFRSFTVVDDCTGNCPCLVVTRVNNKLVLEPEDCKKRKKYVCLENVRRNLENNIETSTFGKTTSDISDKVEENTRIINGKREIDFNSLIISISISVCAILALFGIAFFFLSVRKICNKTQTPVITDSTKESHELDPVNEEQPYDDIPGSYVVLDPEPLNGEERSQSSDGKAKTTIKKAEYGDDSSPIWLHNNPKDNLNTDLYSYDQIGNDHVSDEYDICSSASRFKKTGATSNNYDKIDLRDNQL